MEYVYIFMDELQEPITSSVKVMEPSTLSISIRKAKLLEGFNYPKGIITKHHLTRTSTMVKNKDPIRGKPPPSAQNTTHDLDYATCEALMKQKLWYSYHNP